MIGDTETLVDYAMSVESGQMLSANEIGHILEIINRTSGPLVGIGNYALLRSHAISFRLAGLMTRAADYENAAEATYQKLSAEYRW